MTGRGGTSACQRTTRAYKWPSSGPHLLICPIMKWRPSSLQTLTREALEKSMDLLRPRGDLPSLQNIGVFVVERNRDLPCALIDSKVQHDWFSCWENGSAKFTLSDGRTILLNEVPLS